MPSPVGRGRYSRAGQEGMFCKGRHDPGTWGGRVELPSLPTWPSRPWPWQKTKRLPPSAVNRCTRDVLTQQELFRGRTLHLALRDFRLFLAASFALQKRRGDCQAPRRPLFIVGGLHVPLLGATVTELLVGPGDLPGGQLISRWQSSVVLEEVAVLEH